MRDEEHAAASEGSGGAPGGPEHEAGLPGAVARLPRVAAGSGLGVGRDVHVTSTGGGVTAGFVQTVNSYQAPSAPVPLPHRIGRVPAVVRDFLERDIPELADADAAAPQLVLAGTAGAGKTQLAARFAEYAWDRGHVRLLLWVDAHSREAVVAAYARAAQDLLGRAFPDPEDGAQAFLNWCRPAGGSEPRPWLVVLDGVTDPADLADGLWPPAAPGSRVLVTSRRRDAGTAGDAVVVAVRGFTYGKVREYLRRALERRGLGAPEDDPLAARIAEHPDTARFLWSASQDVVDRGLPPDTYLDRLAAGTLDAAHHPMSRSIEVAQLMAPEGLALPLLRMIASVGNCPVPERVLLHRWARGCMVRLATVRGSRPRDVTEQDVRAALHGLHSLSLVERGPAGPYRTVRVETPARAAAMAELDSEQRPVIAGAVAEALDAVWPDPEPGADIARLFWDYEEELNGSSLTTVPGAGVRRVVYRAGDSLGSWGRPDEAHRHFGRRARDARYLLGEEHPDTLKARMHAARWLGASGADAEAAAELGKVLAAQEGVLPADHPDILTTRHHLAWCHLSATSWGMEEPRAALAAVLRDRTRVLGPDHPDTLTTLGAVVHALVNQGQDSVTGEDADAAGERLPGVTRVRRGFAVADLAEALVGELTRILGPAHLETISARWRLAVVHSRQGSHARAYDIAAATVEDATAVVGPDHPVTLNARATLARVMKDRGDRGKALEALDALHADQSRLIGAGHPDTLVTYEIRMRLGIEETGRITPADILAACAELRTAMDATYAPDHRRSRQVLSTIATLQTQAGQHIAAVVTLTDLVVRSSRALGPTHRATLGARARLADQRGDAGDLIGAIAGLAEVLSERAVALGADHPDTLETRHLLGWFRGQAGDHVGAVAEFTQLVADYERTGAQDSSAADNARKALAGWQHKLRS